jgi:lipoyl(octanoyl) transferase
MTVAPQRLHREIESRVLRVYLLGTVDFVQALRLQQALVAQVSLARHSAALILCEHPLQVTVGRHGRPADLDSGDEEDGEPFPCPVRWVNRGGGCLLHAPGQLAIYPILALDSWGLGIGEYLARLHEVLLAVLDDFSVEARIKPGQPDVWIGRRPIASVGIAVRSWVAYFGAALNINPDLTLYRHIRTGQPGDEPMTSLVRERHGGLRPSLVRDRLLEHFAANFPYFERTTLFSNHPLVTPQHDED